MRFGTVRLYAQLEEERRTVDIAEESIRLSFVGDGTFRADLWRIESVVTVKMLRSRPAPAPK